MGSLTQGMMGGGFLYTNKDSISLGIVVAMHRSMMRTRTDELKCWQLLDEFKEPPQIKPLVAGGTLGRVLGARHPRGRHRQGAASSSATATCWSATPPAFR